MISTLGPMYMLFGYHGTLGVKEALCEICFRCCGSCKVIGGKMGLGLGLGLEVQGNNSTDRLHSSSFLGLPL